MPLSLVFICQENLSQLGTSTFWWPSQIFPICIGYLPEVCPRFSRNATFVCDRGTGAQQFRGVVMSEIHCGWMRTSPTIQIWVFICRNDHRPLQKSGTRQEAPNSPDLSQLIPNDQRFLQFQVFICRQNLGRLGNSKIPDSLRFSRHMKTRLYWH